MVEQIQDGHAVRNASTITLATCVRRPALSASIIAATPSYFPESRHAQLLLEGLLWFIFWQFEFLPMIDDAKRFFRINRREKLTEDRAAGRRKERIQMAALGLLLVRPTWIIEKAWVRSMNSEQLLDSTLFLGALWTVLVVSLISHVKNAAKPSNGTLAPSSTGTKLF